MLIQPSTINAFQTLCHALQRHLCFTGTRADWLRWLTEAAQGDIAHATDAFALIQRAFIQKEDQLATHVACPQCYCAHEVFIWTEEKMKALGESLYPAGAPQLSEPIQLPGIFDGSVYQPSTINQQLCTISAVCRCADEVSCPELFLTLADIEHWTLSWPRLARALSKALGLNSQFNHLKLSNTWQIGSWSADTVPVIVTVQPDPHHLRAAILELTGILNQRFILFTPTCRDLDAHCLELLGRADSALFPLDANLILTHNATLQPTKTAGALFAKFTPQPKETDLSVAERAFGLIKAFGDSTNPPTHMATFRHYCIEELSAAQIAQKYQCSKATVISRLNDIRARTGMDPEKLRAISTHLHKRIEENSDSRASHLHRKNLIEDSDSDASEN